MEIAALALAALAVLIALAARSKAAGLSQAAEDAKAEARRLAENAREEGRTEAQNLRRLLCLVKDGAPLSDEMILEGRLWRDVSQEEGLVMQKRGELLVLDVRTPQETAMGVIPGAVLIPIDQLERRVAEIPRDGRKALVYCAGGGRSAAACEFLSTQGILGLHNLVGGMSSWTGPVERRS